jgi:hypothetical protein
MVSAQNPDGGWPYRATGGVRAGSSRTEPTVYALLALSGESDSEAAVEKGLVWLRGMQQKDGGFAPERGIAQSTWVTALPALLPPERLGAERHAAAVRWIEQRATEDSSFVFRLRQIMMGQRPADPAGASGWSWYPGTAGWVTPTCISLLALAKAARRQSLPAVVRRMESGRRFLVSRRCGDGGWNHGSARALGYEGNSYPETTGQALLALAGVRGLALEPSLERAERHWRECRFSEGASWLELGLRAHGRIPPEPASASPPRTVCDAALARFVADARRGRNIFLE